MSMRSFACIGIVIAALYSGAFVMQEEFIRAWWCFPTVAVCFFGGAAAFANLMISLDQ